MTEVGYKKSLDITEQDSLLDIELPQPIPDGQDLLVRVKAISVNPVDTKIRQHAEPEQDEFKVLGWDAAGGVGSMLTQLASRLTGLIVVGKIATNTTSWHYFSIGYTPMATRNI